MEHKRIPEDSELVARCRRGDLDAFEKLVQRHQERVFHLVRGILGDWHLSEDTCQEIFTVVYRRLDGFRESAKFSTWLYRISVNAALRTRKRARRRREEPLAGAPFAAKDDQREFEGDEVFQKLLQPLPDRLRVPIVLKEQGGLTYEEVARVLGCSRGAVEQRIHRAMVQLREIWRERFAERG